MRAAAVNGARVALVATPGVLAFFSGGYFDEPRAWAGLVIWLLVAVAMAAVPHPLPEARSARLALLFLALLAAWTLLSITWAPVAGDAYHRGQLAILYLGALLAAAMLLRGAGAVAAAELAVAVLVLIVIGYGLSERLLPGLLHFQYSLSAEGRLDQPLTYWNAMGELAAMGVVMCARVAGEGFRPRPLRLAALAAAVPLGAGLYITFSRGALFACFAGFVALAVIAPTREAWRSGALAAAGAIAGGVACVPFHGVTAYLGTRSAREEQGLIVLGLLLVVMVLVALAGWRMLRRPVAGTLSLSRPVRVGALLLVTAGLAIAIVAGAQDKPSRSLSGGAARLATLQSNRYAYWSVAMRAFRAEPIRGVGAGGWSVYWLRYRTRDEFARDAHSLPLQTMAELGLVGAVLLAGFVVTLVLAARRALRLDPALVAGPVAVAAVYAAHAPLDWDWEMPTVTLVALVMAGAVVGAAGRRAPAAVVETEPRRLRSGPRFARPAQAAMQPPAP